MAAMTSAQMLICQLSRLSSSAPARPPGTASTWFAPAVTRAAREGVFLQFGRTHAFSSANSIMTFADCGVAATAIP